MNYEVYAIRYCSREGRSSTRFYGGVDPEGDRPMPMDYFIWVARSPQHTVIIDTGFNEEVADRRGRPLIDSPISLLRHLDIEAADVSEVILTHMHFDHAGNVQAFPRATFTLQAAEMEFWTGPYSSRSWFSRVIEPDDVAFLARQALAGRVKYVKGVRQVLPGITVHQTGGHTPGMQIVTIETTQGTVVLASDASHFYRNIEEDLPFVLTCNLAEMYSGFDLIRSLAEENPNLIIPGHDPLVMARFPAAGPGLEGIAVRIA